MEKRKVDVLKESHNLFAKVCKERKVQQIDFLDTLFSEIANNKAFQDQCFNMYYEAKMV